MVVKTYMDMDQDSEEEKQQYLGLALHLASEFFLRNPNKDVRLLVACCLADIFRIYAPEAPYTSHDKLKVRNWPMYRKVLYPQYFPRGSMDLILQNTLSEMSFYSQSAIIHSLTFVLLLSQDIFLFITRQLKGLEDSKSPQFNRYFYLLEVNTKRHQSDAGVG